MFVEVNEFDCCLGSMDVLTNPDVDLLVGDFFVASDGLVLVRNPFVFLSVRKSLMVLFLVTVGVSGVVGFFSVVDRVGASLPFN